MVATSQKYALARVLAHEGGDVDDPRDPGGRTSQGVTQRVYDAWRRSRGQPTRDVFRIANAEVRDIYLEQYWHRVRADELPPGVDYAVFDAAVNSGPVQAVKWLQRALGDVRVDGVVGRVTLASVAAHPDKARLVRDICARRMAFLKQLRTWGRFGKGWTRRVAAVESAAVAMVEGRRPAGGAVAAGGARAEPAHIRVARGAGAAQAVAGAGLATAAAAEAVGHTLKQAAAEIGAASQKLAALDWMASSLAVVGALALAAGVSWRLYVGLRQRSIAAACSELVAPQTERKWSLFPVGGSAES